MIYRTPGAFAGLAVSLATAVALVTRAIRQKQEKPPLKTAAFALVNSITAARAS